MIYVWLGIVITAIVVEAIVPGLVAIWFVPSGLISLALAFFEVPVDVQIILFVVLSVACIFLSQKFLGKRKKSFTGADTVVGQSCLVREKICNLDGVGKVKLNGMDWTARAESNDETFEIGEIVTVVRIEGVKLIVKK